VFKTDQAIRITDIMILRAARSSAVGLLAAAMSRQPQSGLEESRAQEICDDMSLEDRQSVDTGCGEQCAPRQDAVCCLMQPTGIVVMGRWRTKD
jgi:hypothetical protein